MFGILQRSAGDRAHKMSKSVRGHTRRHVKGRAAPEICGVTVRSGQPKIGQFNGEPTVRNENVLRLEIPMVDTLLVAALHRIQDLEEHTLGQEVVSHVMTLLRDVREQVAFRAELQDDECSIDGIHYLDEGDNVGMGASRMVKLDLLLLELSLPGIEANFVQGLNCILDIRGQIDGSINDTVRANPEDRGQPQAMGENLAKSRLGGTRNRGGVNQRVLVTIGRWWW